MENFRLLFENCSPIVLPIVRTSSRKVSGCLGSFIWPLFETWGRGRGGRMWPGSGRIEVFLVLEFFVLGEKFRRWLQGYRKLTKGEGGEMDGELAEIWRKWFTMICFAWYTWHIRCSVKSREGRDIDCWCNNEMVYWRRESRMIWKIVFIFFERKKKTCAIRGLRHRRNFCGMHSHTHSPTTLNKRRGKLIFTFYCCIYISFNIQRKQHSPKNTCFNLTSTFVRKEFWNYICKFSYCMYIYIKQIFYFIHRIPLQNVSAIRTGITTIIRLPQHPGVVFFPPKNSTILSIFIPNPTLAIINIRENEKKEETVDDHCVNLRSVSSSNETVDMARGNREYLDPGWDRCSTFRKGHREEKEGTMVHRVAGLERKRI